MKIERVQLLIFFALLICIVSVSLYFYPYQIDDAYITYQYAKNIILNSDFSFTPGRPWVEGFSSPVWLSLMVLTGYVFGTSALPKASMFLGIISMVLNLIVCFRIGVSQTLSDSDQFKRTIVSILPVVLIGAIPAFVFYSSTGMEALIFWLCIIVSIALAIGAIDKNMAFPFVLLLPWLRPEAPVVFLSFVALTALLKNQNTIVRKKLFLISFVYLASQLLLVLIRWMMFGEFFPNTYFAKEPSVILGIESLFNNFMQEPYLIVIFLFSIFATILGNYLIRSLFLLGFFWSLIFVFEGGGWMPLGRLLIPSVIFMSFSVALLPVNIQTANNKSKRIFFFIYFVMLILLLVFSGYSIRKWQEITENTNDTIRREGTLLLQMLNKASIQSLACVDIGIPAFYSDMEIVDLAGLTDRIIGKSKGTLLKKEYDPNYILNNRSPDAVLIRVHGLPELSGSGQLNGLNVDLVNSAVEKRLLSHVDFLKHYNFGFAIFPSYERAPFYGRVVFVRKNKAFQLIPLGLAGIHYSHY